MSDHEAHRGKMSGGAKLVFVGFAIVAGYYLLTEHAAHVLSALPLLLFLSCPIMHLFMHHGHKHDRNLGPTQAGVPPLPGPNDGGRHGNS